MGTYRQPYNTSPMMGAQAQPFSAPPGQSIQPGQITYTTTTDAQGRVTYHPFRAEPASYQTSQGVVNGIQWVPAEATQILPAGAQPAGPDFTASWNRGYLDRGQDRAIRDWQKDEEKRKKKEEKDAAKRVAAWEKEKQDRERAEEKEMRRVQARERERRLSSSGYGNPAAAAAGGYGAPPPIGGPMSAYDPERRYSGVAGDLDRHLADLDIGTHRERKLSTHSGYGARPRPASMSMPDPNRTSAYGGVYDRESNSSGGYGSTAGPAGYPGGGGAVYPNATYPSDRSPYRGPGQLPAGGQDVYPPGHIMEGHPISPGTGPTIPGVRSRTPLPPGYPTSGVAFPTNPSPRIGGVTSLGYADPQMGGGMQQLASPASFTRPINRAQAFTPFEMHKVQDMDEFLSVIPRLPPVLTTHDVLQEDWVRLMNDLALAWRGRLPLPSFPPGRTPKRSSVVADLLDLWNGAFLLPRYVELVLYKGRECRSGRNAGRPEVRLPRIVEESDWSSTASSEESITDQEDSAARYGHYGAYGRHIEGQERWATELRDARRYRRQHKAERKRRAAERRMRRKEREKSYTLYVTFVPPRDYPPSHGLYGH